MNKLSQALNDHFENTKLQTSHFCSVKTEHLIRAIFNKTNIQSIQLDEIGIEQTTRKLMEIRYRVGGLERKIFIRSINDIFNESKPTLAAECFCDKQFRETGRETVCGFTIRNGELVAWD